MLIVRSLYFESIRTHTTPSVIILAQVDSGSIPKAVLTGLWGVSASDGGFRRPFLDLDAPTLIMDMGVIRESEVA